MTRPAQQVASVGGRGGSGTTRLLVGGGAVLTCTIGLLSIAWAAGVLRGEPSDESQRPVAASEASVAVASTVAEPVAGVGMAALRQAAEEQKYLFAFFWKTEDHQTTSMRKVFDQAVEPLAERAQSVVVRVSDRSESDIAKKFDLGRAPMPLVLAIAPNGAVTGGFATKFEESDLRDAFGSPAMEQCLGALQEGRLVLLCAQNESTRSNAEALRGVEQFRADPRFTAATQVVMVDPRDPAEAPFLGDLRIDPNTTEAVTAFLVPPGSAIAEFVGPTTKEAIMSALQNAGSCGPGGACGPGGCGPQ